MLGVNQGIGPRRATRAVPQATHLTRDRKALSSPRIHGCKLRCRTLAPLCPAFGRPAMGGLGAQRPSGPLGPIAYRLSRFRLPQLSRVKKSCMSAATMMPLDGREPSPRDQAQPL